MERQYSGARQKVMPGGMNPWWRTERMRGYAAGVALLTGFLSGLVACDMTPAAVIMPTADATATATIRPPGLPAFSDWRIGYVDATQHVHAVSVDGKTDVTGDLSLSGLSRTGWSVPAAELSSNGHLLAYAAPDSLERYSGVSVLDASGQQPAYNNASVYGFQLEWSRDGTELAIGTGNGVDILRPTEGGLSVVPPSSSLIVRYVLGWMDVTHLVVVARPPSTPPTAGPNSTPVSSGSGSGGTEGVTLYVLDIVSGALHPVVTLSSATMGIADFTLSPDGQTVFYDNRPFRDHPFTPDVALIKVKSGIVTHLPHAAGTTAAWFTGVAFLPGTDIIAVSQGFFLTGGFKTWLLDTARDTAAPLREAAGVAVGWVPGTQTLILTTGTSDSRATGQGPYTISAVPDVLTNPQAAATTLATNAWTFPWLGFVKTA